MYLHTYLFNKYIYAHTFIFILDEQVTWGDKDVSLNSADTQPKQSGIRDLFKGVTGESGW